MTAVSRLTGTTQFGEEKKNTPGNIQVQNCNEVRVTRCILLKGLTQCSRKPFEDNKLFILSKGDRNRKSSIVLLEIRIFIRPWLPAAGRWLSVLHRTRPQWIIVFTWVIRARCWSCVPRAPERTNSTLLKSAVRKLDDVVKWRTRNYFGLGRRDFERLISAFARLYTMDDPFHHAFFSSLLY